MGQRDFIKSSMIDVSLDSDYRVSLNDLIIGDNSIPIRLFQDTESASVESAISKAVSYLTEKREGQVCVPADVNNKSVIVKARVNKSNQVVINYITSNYRFPINQESRPYNGGDWKIGDIIFNNDYTDSKCMGWVCTADGTPGTWIAFAYMRNWFTQIEKVDELPQPGPMQEGRQLICRSSDNLTYLWYCAITHQDDTGADVYEWVKQNIFESDIENKIEELFTPAWNQLMDDLDNNLSDRIGPAIQLYFQNNPIPVIRATKISETSGNWTVSELENSTTYELLPDKFILMVQLPSASVNDNKLIILGNQFDVKSYSGSSISEGELASGILAQFSIDKSNKVAYYSSGSRIADNMCYLNINVALSSMLVTPDPGLLNGLTVTATSSSNTYSATTNSSGSCLLEVPADDYSVDVSNITGYSSGGAVHLVTNAIKGKTTVVPLTLEYNKGKLVVQANFNNNLNNISEEDITGTKVTIKKSGSTVSEGFMTVVSGVGSHTAVGSYTPTDYLDAANSDQYTISITPPETYAAPSDFTISGSQIRDTTYTTKGIDVNYVMGNLRISLQNSYTADPLNNVVLTINKLDPGSSGQLGSETATVSTGSPITKLLDGRYNYEITVDKENWPSGYEVDAPVLVQGSSLYNTTYSITVSMVKLRQIIMSFTIATNNSDPSGSVTYGDSAVGKTPGDVSWMNEWPFNQVFPALIRNSDKKLFKLNKTNVTQYADGSDASSDLTSTTYNAIVVLPKLWYKFEYTDSNHLKVSISSIEESGFQRFPADTSYDYACKGMFEGWISGDRLYSLRSKTPTADITIGTARNAASNLGTGFCQNTFEIQKVLEILFVLYYKSLNSQRASGNGNSTGSYLKTGSVISQNAGSLSHHEYGSTGTTSGMKFLWIENFWANYWEWVDGLLINNYQVYTQYDISQFHDSTSGYTATGESVNSRNGYVSKVIGSNESGFLPSAVSGSETTYYCDYYWVNSGLRVALFGGGAGFESFCGAFCWALTNDSSFSYSVITSRVCVYLTQAEYDNAS